jgi:hypothetical protein
LSATGSYWRHKDQGTLAIVTLFRSVVAVVIGYAVFAASAVLLFHTTGRDPHAPQNAGFVLFAVVYGMLFAGLGGLLAVHLAPTKGTLPAVFVSGMIALGATVPLVTAPGAGAT